jgi:hypothetical protein
MQNPLIISNNKIELLSSPTKRAKRIGNTLKHGCFWGRLPLQWRLTGMCPS